MSALQVCSYVSTQVWLKISSMIAAYHRETEVLIGSVCECVCQMFFHGESQALNNTIKERLLCITLS